MLYYTILQYTLLYYTVQYCTILYYTIPYYVLTRCMITSVLCIPCITSDALLYMLCLSTSAFAFHGLLEAWRYLRGPQAGA